MQNPLFSRRDFLAGSMASVGLGSLPWPAQALGTGAIKTPPAMTLTAAPATLNIVGDEYPNTDLWTYNGSVPGPLLRFKQGETASIQLANNLPEATSIHWHGIRTPNAMDGVPGLTQNAVEPGETFLYEFKTDDAGTFWYHPHANSPEQIERGLQGMIIVEEAEPPVVDRDVTWVLDDWRLDEQAAIVNQFNSMGEKAHAGRYGNAITRNGTRQRDFTLRSGERVRIRLLNSANGRIFALKFTDHAPWVIAKDGHGVEPHPAPDGRVIIAPGQRIDLILDALHEPDQNFDVLDDSNPRFTYEFQKLVYSDEKPLRSEPLAPPKQLAANPLAEPDLGKAKRHNIHIQGGAHGNLAQAKLQGKSYDIQGLVQRGKVWALNGVAYAGPEDQPLLQFSQGETQIITFKNDTGWPHPMHIHGHSWQVLTRNGQPMPRKEWGDTILLGPEEEAEVAFVADNPGRWLLHCHVLEHMSGGMGCIVEVA